VERVPVGAKQNAPAHGETGRIKICARISFSPDTVEAGIGTCIETYASTGCRGFIGPVPLPLCMRPVISTDAD